jgi:hypothetical protein
MFGMGKIEDCFGSKEEGEFFAINAYEQPILRLTVEQIHHEQERGEYRSPDIRFQVIAGIVIGAALSEPSAESIKAPAIDIEPSSIASAHLSRRELKKYGGLRQGIHQEVQDRTSLLLRNPVLDAETISPSINAIVESERGVLTVTRAPRIRAAIQTLEADKVTNAYANTLWTLSKVALGNIWQ